MRRVTGLFLTIALAFSLAMPVWAAEPDPASAAPATRAMLCAALWEREGSPVVNYLMTFTDVDQNADNAEAIRWAAAEKLVGGVGDGRFCPDGALDREQLAVILYRYAKYRGMDVSVGEDTNILSYTDFLERSDWAVPALQWAVGSGLLDTKDGGRLGARDTVTQAGTAAVLERFDGITIHAGLLQSWTEGSEPKTILTAYMAAITDPDSADYIPVEDRIAVFDLDGTLMCETYPRCFEYMVFVDYALNNPNYTPTDEIRAVAQEIIDTRWQEKPSGISTRQAAAAAIAYKGMTPAELEAYVTGFMNSDAEGFTGLKRGEAFYQPMVELVRFLEANDFTVYIVTATERNIVRALVKDTLGIPPAHVIGTEYGYTATGQGDTEDGDYTFQPADQVVFDGSYYGENAKMSKVDAIVREIGQQPVLAFGNSSGDVAMCEYTVANNPYYSLSYIVLADDEEREWGDAESAWAKIEGYTRLGIGTISMRNDFAMIYGPGVEKNIDAPNR
ncbi:MAG: hypothetical protein E7425_05510 [Ruminococcaceae bacterium]|nr:hypothetical protein [Oscillospiraceae bacterium]